MYQFQYIEKAKLTNIDVFVVCFALISILEIVSHIAQAGLRLSVELMLLLLSLKWWNSRHGPPGPARVWFYIMCLIFFFLQRIIEVEFLRASDCQMFKMHHAKGDFPQNSNLKLLRMDPALWGWASMPFAPVGISSDCLIDMRLCKTSETWAWGSYSDTWREWWLMDEFNTQATLKGKRREVEVSSVLTGRCISHSEDDSWVLPVLMEWIKANNKSCKALSS